MSKKLYTLTEEHKAKIPEHVKKWTDIILDTKRLSTGDKELCVSAVNNMYDIAKLERPSNIVFVSSPILLAFSSGISRLIWNKKRDATFSATYDATYSATRDATSRATYDATYSATYDATYDATDSATDSATRDATYDATRSATDSAIYSATRDATISATHSATSRATDSATHSATISATADATSDATYAATSDATYDATRDATRSATSSATDSATRSATSRATDSATHSATISATADATSDATYAATSDATYDATRDATRSATDSATSSATRSATYDATDSATDSATRDATRDATDSATDSATHSATYDATDSATDSATYDATRSATSRATFEISQGVVVPELYWQSIRELCKQFNVDFSEAVTFVKGATSVWQGGCNWAQYDSFLSFFQDIVGLDIDYSKYQPYKDLTVAGYRVLSKDFAMISEKPLYIKMKNNLAHNLDGAAIEFMDGVKYYMAYGNLIPSYIVTTPIKDITKEMILNEKNADHRRYLIERIGIEKYMTIIGVDKVLDTYKSPVGGVYELLQVKVNNELTTYLKMINQSEFVFHVEGVPNDVKTVKQALMFRNGMVQFKEPKFLS